MGWVCIGVARKNINYHIQQVLYSCCGAQHKQYYLIGRTIRQMQAFNRVPKITQQQLQSRYEQKDLIDAGSYGIVFKYLDKVSQQFVAIKILKEESGLEGFEKEEQIMNQVDHDNVLKCLGFYYNTTKSQYLLITPYCNKNNLRTCLGQIAKMDEKMKIWLCVQIARGINALHEKNIMHRDIKPANILVTDNWELKLCDFGFGKYDLSLKQTVKVGTPIYRDPNVNLGKYSKKCDMYSVGLVYDTIFRGESCFNKVPESLFQQELIYFKENKKKIINKLNCSDEMKEIILGCLESDETKRTSSKALVAKMEEMWARLNPRKQDSSYEKAIQNEINEANLRKFNDIQTLKQPQNEQKATRMPTQPTQSLGQSEVFYDFEEALSERRSMIKPTHKSNYQLPLGKKLISMSETTNDADFLSRLLSTRMSICKNIEKNSNFQTVYRHFVDRRHKIRELNELSKVRSIPNNIKKIVIFVGMFGYLRFLKISKSFLKQEKPVINDIGGVRIGEISKKTLEICLDLIEKEIPVILKNIKPFLNDLDMDQHFYKENLTSNVLSMIDNGINKKFLEIQNYRQEVIASEYESILMSKKYEVTANDEIQLKAKLLKIRETF